MTAFLLAMSLVFIGLMLGGLGVVTVGSRDRVAAETAPAKPEA